MDRIKVQIGTVQMNKTSRFVKPCLRLYGEDFIKKLNSIYKLAYGVGDMFINKEYSQHIFILIDTKKCINHWITSLDWVRQQEYYEDDYAFDDLVTGRLHMLVIKLPDEIDLEYYSHFIKFHEIKKKSIMKRIFHRLKIICKKII